VNEQPAGLACALIASYNDNADFRTVRCDMTMLKSDAATFVQSHCCRFHSKINRLSTINLGLATQEYEPADARAADRYLAHVCLSSQAHHNNPRSHTWHFINVKIAVIIVIIIVCCHRRT
jgi:hypothetical protein